MRNRCPASVTECNQTHSLVQVGTDSDWESVSTSITWCFTVMGIKTDGSLWAWGSGEDFCLGQGDTRNSSVPIRVGTDNDWKQVSIGSTYVLPQGTTAHSGAGDSPRINSSSTNRGGSVKVPTRISNDKWLAVYAINNASYGVKEDGTLWAWGDNQENILGLNSDMSGTGRRCEP